MRKSRLLILVLGILVFVTSFFYVVWPKYQEAQRAKMSTFVASPVTYNIPVPQQARQVEILSVKGDVVFEARGSDEEIEASAGVIIEQGGKIRTGSDGLLKARLPGAEIALGKNSEVGFINLLPQTLLLEQPVGQVTYTLADEMTLTVRALDSLTLLQGKARLRVAPEDHEVEISVIEGSAVVGLLTAEETLVKNLLPGQTGTVDTQARTIQIR